MAIDTIIVAGILNCAMDLIDNMLRVLPRESQLPVSLYGLGDKISIWDNKKYSFPAFFSSYP